MMALDSGSNADSSGQSATRTANANNPYMRRLRSKGTIAGYAFNKGSGATSTNASMTEGSKNGSDGVAQPSSSPTSSQLAVSNQKSQNVHGNDAASQKPPAICHSALLVLLACENAILLGARTQLGLCPPGRSRRTLQAALRQRLRGIHKALQARSPLQKVGDGYFSLERMLGTQSLDEYVGKDDEFLSDATAYEAGQDEDASSGDEDELTNVDDLLNDNLPILDDENKYSVLREPLFTPIGADPATAAGTGSMGGMINNGQGKLPFNRRKILFFDSSTAGDHALARHYLSSENRKSRQREVLLLTRHLRRMQKEERERVRSNQSSRPDDSDLSDPENDFLREKRLATTGMDPFDGPVTPSMASALLIESLSLNSLESLEGMANCYEGIVHAGVAVLELSMHDATSSLKENETTPRGRSEIVAALTVLLITSLQRPSGEAILSLAKLRRMCGTPRYQRRFVQRIAPALVRPPHGAMWCLRHQHDMEPILAAVELILDSASEIFSKGWYERGQLLLADSKRVETLNAAAAQLRNLGGDSTDGLTLGLTTHSHGMWRTNKFNTAASHTKDGSKSPDALAEWEVIALDRQIRVSISNIISTDWSSIAPSAETARMGSYPRSRSTSFGKRQSGVLQTHAGDMSPKGILSTPLSPARPMNTKTAASLPGQPSHGNTASAQSSTGASDAIPSSIAANKTDVESGSNSTSLTIPVKPSPRQASNPETGSGSAPSEQPPSVPPPSSSSGSQTPPRSPRRELPGDVFLTPSASTGSPNSPPVTTDADIDGQQASGALNRNAAYSPSTKGMGSPSTPGSTTENDRAPLSPSSPHIPSSSELGAYRNISSSSSVVSSSTMESYPGNYKMLTSTAADRKRTVAACRALRSQILRFEDAFKQLHGRPPRKATERAPLASTYAQYREWKKAIRADAACRISGLIRGFLVRRRLFRSNDPAKVRFIANRREKIRQKYTQGQDNIISRLSLPADIGDPGIDNRNRNGSSSSLASASSNSLRYDDDSSVNSSGSGIPRGGNSRRRPGDRPDGFPISPASRPFSPQQPPASPASISNDDDLTQLSLRDLLTRKRDLKQQLRQYDLAFARRHGRMPVKAEKEPIRNLYETYNTLKSLIARREMEAQNAASPVPVQQSQPQQSAPRLSPRTMSPTQLQDPVHESQRARVRRPMDPAPASSPPVPTQAAGPDLASLRIEKGRLHQMLRSYERDFFREHNRQVSSFADIRPVASEYRRYKEIKRAIAAAQQESDSER